MTRKIGCEYVRDIAGYFLGKWRIKGKRIKQEDIIAYQPLPQPYKKDHLGEVNGMVKPKPAWEERLMNTFLGGRD